MLWSPIFSPNQLENLGRIDNIGARGTSNLMPSPAPNVSFFLSCASRMLLFEDRRAFQSQGFCSAVNSPKLWVKYVKYLPHSVSPNYY